MNDSHFFSSRGLMSATSPVRESSDQGGASISAINSPRGEREQGSFY